MRIIRPEDFKQLKNPVKKHSKNRKLILVFLILVTVFVACFSLILNQRQKGSNDQAAKITSANEAEGHKGTKLKTFTGEQFKALARNIRYPNTQVFEQAPSITGNELADEKIRQIAVERGYKLTSLPVTPIVKIDEPRLYGDDLLQPLASEAWKSLKAAAKKDGIPLSLLSAYRSPEYQRNLFNQRLFAKKVSLDSIIAGNSDAVVTEVLKGAAIPGFSRHHTGYTIDLWCEDGSGNFESSLCYKWISADNYKKAKESSWVPSYPEGASLQGPEPEPWEYVWVSHDVLYD